MKNKYQAKKTYANGMVFDSIKEADRYFSLYVLQRAGKIKNLRRQVKFEHLPTQYETFPRYSDKTGKRLTDGKRAIEKGCTYIADFVYEENGKTIVEDTKGFKTEAYKIKKKMMLYFHGIKIREV
jgi:hypothetical protein